MEEGEKNNNKTKLLSTSGMLRESTISDASSFPQVPACHVVLLLQKRQLSGRRKQKCELKPPLSSLNPIYSPLLCCEHNLKSPFCSP